MVLGMSGCMHDCHAGNVIAIIKRNVRNEVGANAGLISVRRCACSGCQLEGTSDVIPMAVRNDDFRDAILAVLDERGDMTRVIVGAGIDYGKSCPSSTR